MNSSAWHAPAAAAAAFSVSCACARILVALAPRLGYVDHPGGRKNHAASTPLLGGVAVLCGGCAGTALLAVWNLAPHRILAVWAVASGAAVALGLMDDRWPLRPLPKLMGLVCAAGLPALAALVLCRAPLMAAATMACALLFFSNAFNLLDNSDGLCASAGAATLAMLAPCGGGRLALVAAAAAAGFLVWNWPRARIFLGDTGSLLIGAWCVLAALAPGPTGCIGHMLPLAAFWVPVYDTLSVTVVRMREGRSVLQGGQDHLSHRLIRRGMTTAGVDRLLAGASVVAGMLALIVPLEWQPLALLALVGAAAVLEAVIPRTPQGASAMHGQTDRRSGPARTG